MCGIFCSLSITDHMLPDAELAERLHNRGPDSQQTVQYTYAQAPSQKSDGPRHGVHIALISTVLSLRGLRTVTQPFQDSDEKYLLCWNGEAWSISSACPHGNDTEAVYGLLVDALEHSADDKDYFNDFVQSATKVAETLSQVAGPYAFVFIDRLRGRLFFGRDFLGRRSLLKRITPGGDLVISSVSDGDPEAGWSEIEADGVYCIELPPIKAASISPESRTLTASQGPARGIFRCLTVPYVYAANAQGHPKSTASVIPRLSLNQEVPLPQIPLNEHSPAVTQLETLLRDSLSFRVLSIPDPPNPVTDSLSFEKAKLAILFSGGLDCTVLARISHDLLPTAGSIDLLNVAFENPRIHNDPNNTADPSHTAYELCPDRITGRSSYAELQRICPGREWRFIAINIPYTETMEHRQKVISLMHPHHTEMDLSISYALYFAARGQGDIIDSNENGPIPYSTTARVLLSGLGADELFGGYTRHATAFRRGGIPGLLDELELDVSRLGKRNLGRDDRVMSHHSKEVRFPYLDEKLLGWALKAPVTDKCGFGEPGAIMTSQIEDVVQQLEPGKKILRCLALKLGMKDVAMEKKRAIQFGARTAKMKTRKTKGTQLLS